MPRVALDLNDGEDRAKVSAGWRVADGLVPGEPNEGLVSQMLASPALDADFDDSGWEECTMFGQAVRWDSPSAGGAAPSSYRKTSTV